MNRDASTSAIPRSVVRLCGAGATNVTTTVTDPNAKAPASVAINLITNKIYTANTQSGNVTVIDGASNATTTLVGPNAQYPFSIGVDAISNRVYVANNGSNNLTVIDGITNTVAGLADVNAACPNFVAVDPLTMRIYVANSCASVGGLSNVSVIIQQNVRKIPIEVTIKPLPHNRTHIPKPTFSFSATESREPHCARIDSLLFQVDIWQNRWLRAKKQNCGRFRGQVKVPLRQECTFSMPTPLTVRFSWCTNLTYWHTPARQIASWRAP
jgi:YVTN family beta-propeller protein